MNADPQALLVERTERVRAAVALEAPDRVPLSVFVDAFAARIMNVRLSEFSSDVDISGRVMLSIMELLGDVDSIQFAVYAPSILGMLWLSPVKLPGRDLPEDTLWQLDEQARVVPEDYDRIIEGGWGPWLGQYIGRYLGEAAAAGRALGEAGPRWGRKYAERGYLVFAPMTVNHPFEHLCGGRSVKEFMLDLYRMPDKVQAVLDVIMEERRVEARNMLRVARPFGCWLGGARTAPEFLSPNLWERFVWPYLRELVEIMVEEGTIPVLHFDSNWDREIARLRELPKGKCVLALDGKTDIFRAKEILGGHMCILGDVPASLLALGTPDEVRAYCRRLLTEVGPAGFIMAPGCGIPFDAKLENVEALVRSVL